MSLKYVTQMLHLEADHKQCQSPQILARLEGLKTQLKLIGARIIAKDVMLSKQRLFERRTKIGKNLTSLLIESMEQCKITKI